VSRRGRRCSTSTCSAASCAVTARKSAPSRAIFLTKEYATVGLNREEMIFHKDRLLAMGGTRPDPIKKWARLTHAEDAAGGMEGAGKGVAR